MLEGKPTIEDRQKIHRRAIEECARMLGNQEVVPKEVWKRQWEDACILRNEVKGQLFPHIRIRKISLDGENYMEKSTLYLEEDSISSKYFIDYTKEVVESVYIILIWMDTITLDSYLEQFYIYLWQTAYMNVTREYLRECFAKEGAHISPFYGPGLYDIPLAGLESLYKKVEVGEVKVIAQRMEPSSSFLGFVFAGQLSEQETGASCKECLGVTGCEFCMLYKSKRKKEEV